MSVKYHVFPIFVLHFWHKYEEIPFFFLNRDNRSAAENRSLPNFLGNFDRGARHVIFQNRFGDV